MLPAFLSNLDPSLYMSDNYVVLDFEIDTSHGDYGHAVHPTNNMLLACWRTGPGHPKGATVREVWGSEFVLGELLQDIASADMLVAHNAKYELGWLRRAGLDLRSAFVFDTKIGEYVLLGNLAAGDETMPPISTSLDACCKRRGWVPKDPVIDIWMKHGINPVRMPRPWLAGRCQLDVSSTEQLFLDQRKRLKATNRLGVQYTRCLLTPVLADMEFAGMHLSSIAVSQRHAEYSELRASLEARMNEVTGGINWRSPKQAPVFIYDVLKFDELTNKRGEPKRTPTGKRLTNKKALAALVARTAEQREFLALRRDLGRVAAALSKSLDFFIGVCAERQSMFYATFNQTSTSTHRLSSSGIPLEFDLFKDARGRPKVKRVQFQNLPRAFKDLFCSRRPGWLMAEPDGSQLEFRVAAYLSQDRQAMSDIENPDYDVHLFTASELFKIPVDAVTAEGPESQRQRAKPETFKPLYGGSRGTPDQERYYAAFRARYPDLARTQAGWVRDVVNTKRLVTPWGMRYFWPYARIQHGYCNVTSAVYNYPIQGLATAEIIPIAVVYLWHRLRERNLEDYVIPVNTIHDSLPCEVHPDYVEQFVDVAKQAFTLDVYNYLDKVYGVCFNVPLGFGVKFGEYLGKGAERAYNVWNNGREVQVK